MEENIESESLDTAEKQKISLKNKLKDYIILFRKIPLVKKLGLLAGFIIIPIVLLISYNFYLDYLFVKRLQETGHLEEYLKENYEGQNVTNDFLIKRYINERDYSLSCISEAAIKELVGNYKNDEMDVVGKKELSESSERMFCLYNLQNLGQIDFLDLSYSNEPDEDGYYYHEASPAVIDKENSRLAYTVCKRTPDNKFGSCTKVFLFDFKSGKKTEIFELKELVYHAGWPNSIEGLNFSNNGERLVITTRLDAYIYNINTGVTRNVIKDVADNYPTPGPGATSGWVRPFISDDGRYIVISRLGWSGVGRPVIYDLENNTYLYDGNVFNSEDGDILNAVAWVKVLGTYRNKIIYKRYPDMDRTYCRNYDGHFKCGLYIADFEDQKSEELLYKAEQFSGEVDIKYIFDTRNGYFYYVEEEKSVRSYNVCKDDGVVAEITPTAEELKRVDLNTLEVETIAKRDVTFKDEPSIGDYSFFWKLRMENINGQQKFVFNVSNQDNTTDCEDCGTKTYVLEDEDPFTFMEIDTQYNCLR